LVAFADGRFRPDEHHALAEVARGLSLPSGRARMLFHLARAQFLAGSNREGNNQQRPRPHKPHPRGDALSILGLPINANKDQIRRRHRELVRKFHPDAQPNLGPVAQKEATDRFRAIQHAYELLTDTP
jgi:DnaJ-domain-containing protein 1